MPADCDHDVAGLHARFFCRTIGMDAFHQDADGPVQPQRSSNFGRYRLAGEAEPGPDQWLARNRAFQHAAHHVAGHGEAQTERSARLGEYRRIDANQPAIHRNQRATGIARVDCRIGLDERPEIADTDGGPGERRNNTAGHGLTYPEGIADGDDQVADFKRIGISEVQERKVQTFRIDLQDSDIRPLVRQNDPGIEFAPVRQDNLDFLGLVDDMVICDDQPAGTDDNPGAQRIFDSFAGKAAKRNVPEQTVE